MTQKEYEYEATIVRTDEANKVMDVLYKSPGRQDVLCGVRLPESMDDIGETIHEAVPFGVWQEAERTVFVPQVGWVVKGIVRIGGTPALESPEAPSIPFFSAAQAGSGTGAGAAAPATDELQGFPTRYVGGEEAARSAEPEVNL